MPPLYRSKKFTNFCFICARHCAKDLTCIISFKAQNYSEAYSIIIVPILIMRTLRLKKIK